MSHIPAADKPVGDSGPQPLVDAWLADVVLADGSTAAIRQLRPEDAERFADFHSRLSKESVRMRYLGARPQLSQVEIDRLVRSGDPDHLALVAERDGAILGMVQYERATGSEEAEVAFVVGDAHQGLGIGTLLFEEAASAARRQGIKRLTADTLLENRRMLEVFHNAGFASRSVLDTGVIHLVMDIAPTAEALDALAERDRSSVVRSMERVLRPRSIAVIGASRAPGTIGHELVVNLVRGGFQGPVYPVNPKAAYIASLPCWESVEAIPRQVDLAVVAVPAAAVEEAVDACGRKGVGALVIVSSGFAETGSEGVATQRAITRLAHSHGMRMVGPNCFGVLNTEPAVSMNATFAADAPTSGRLGFGSQSGGLGIAILGEARARGIGLSSFVSMGNKADVSGNDLLAWWDQDEATSVVLLYLESFGNPRKFARLARRVSSHKPVIVVKAGRSPSGRRAASSHTAALASTDEVVAALCRQTGVIRVDTIEELFDVAEALDGQPLAAGRRIGILTNSGGPGVLAADSCSSVGLVVPELSVSVRQSLSELLPAFGGVGNPVDLSASASAAVYGRVLEILMGCGEVDAVVAIFTPPLVTRTEDVAQAVADAVDKAAEAGRQIPVVASLLGTEDGRALLRQQRHPVPSFTYPETAVRALSHAVGYAEWRRRPSGAEPVLEAIDANGARRLLGAGSGWVTGAPAMAVLDRYGIPTVPSVDVHSASEAVEAAQSVDGPVALKAIGPNLLHKSDVGGVRLGLRGAEAVSSAYLAMANSVGEGMTGALVQPMVQSGLETIVGAVQEPGFGPLVIFGLGGTTVELLGDHVSRLAPLTDLDAREMISGLHGSALLTGYRGSAALDVDALADILLRVSRLVEDLPELVELDCNPVIVLPKGATVVDSRLRLVADPVTPPEDTRPLR